jgi:hypothetical protein
MWSFDYNDLEDNQISRKEYKQHYENNVTIKDKDNEKYTFHIKDLNAYIYYAGGYIAPEIKITRADGRLRF